MTGADLPVARHVRDLVPGEVADDRVSLTHDASLLRRKRLETVTGTGFLVDLAHVTGVAAGQVLVLSDGRLVERIAAEEDLLEVRGDLPRLAWHIGNRHAPCQIEGDRILIRADKVLERMLQGLGAQVRAIRAPFTPEGGAYGHGRTMGHSHGHGADQRNGHDHDHAQAQEHGLADHHPDHD